MPKITASNQGAYYDVIALCAAYGLILVYGFYQDFFMIKFQILYSPEWNLESVILVLNYPISLFLIYLLFRGYNFAWIIFVILNSLIVLTAVVDLTFEMQLPDSSSDDSLLNSLFDLVDPRPRLGYTHYITILITYGSLVLFAMKDNLLSYFSVSQNHKLIAIAIPIILAIIYGYRSI